MWLRFGLGHFAKFNWYCAAFWDFWIDFEAKKPERKTYAVPSCDDRVADSATIAASLCYCSMNRLLFDFPFSVRMTVDVAFGRTTQSECRCETCEGFSWTRTRCVRVESCYFVSSWGFGLLGLRPTLFHLPFAWICRARRPWVWCRSRTWDIQNLWLCSFSLNCWSSEVETQLCSTPFATGYCRHWLSLCLFLIRLLAFSWDPKTSLALATFVLWGELCQEMWLAEY